MAFLIVTAWNGQRHISIEHGDVPRRRTSLGKDERPIPLTRFQAEMTLDVLVPLLRVIGKLK